MEQGIERCCPRVKRYKPNFYVKELRKIWPEDEEMKRELRLYDEAHSRSKCVTIEYFDQLQEELLLYSYGKKQRFCSLTHQSLVECLQNTGHINQCQEKLNTFLECVNLTIKETYASK